MQWSLVQDLCSVLVISFIFLSVDSLLIENYMYTIPPKLGISSKNQTKRRPRSLAQYNESQHV